MKDSTMKDIIETKNAYQQKRKESRIQKENKRIYNKKKKAPAQYRGDLIAIKRTQARPGLKFAVKYLGIARKHFATSNILPKRKKMKIHA